MSRSDHKGNKIKNSHIQTKRVYILRHSIDAKNVKKIACITTNVHELKQKKYRIYGKRVHRVYLRLIEQINSCCRLLAKDIFFERTRRQTIRLRGKIANHYISGNKSHYTAAVDWHLDGTCRIKYQDTVDVLCRRTIKKHFQFKNKKCNRTSTGTINCTFTCFSLFLHNGFAKSTQNVS